MSIDRYAVLNTSSLNGREFQQAYSALKSYTPSPYNGLVSVNTADTAVPPTKVPTLLEAMGSDGKDKSEQYCLAAELWLHNLISWEKCMNIQASRKLMPGFVEYARAALEEIKPKRKRSNLEVI